MTIVGAGLQLFWIVGMLFVLLLVVAVVIAATRGSSAGPHQALPAGPPPPPAETPLDILARRFAKGEITADEYQKARDLLRGDGTP